MSDLHPKDPSKNERELESSEQNLDKLKNLFTVVEKAKQFWEATFDSMIHPVMIVDEHYQIQRANLTLANSIEQDVRSLIGKTCYQVFALRQSPCAGCPLQKTWETHQPYHSRVEVFPDEREYQASSFPFQKKEEPGLSIVQYRDIREERLLQARLIQSEKMAAIGLLAGGIAHEINNPLSGVLAFAQLAMGQVDSQSQVYEDLKEIESSALRCKKIVENLLEFSRQSNTEEREKIDLAEVLDRVLPLLKLQIKEASVYLETQTEGKPFYILGHRNQLEQVFLNLTSNACHATPSGGKVKIRIKEEDAQWIRLEISDNGKGIKKEHLSKIFDPFFTTKKVGMGTGLGLSITYSILQDHGGRVEVNSSEEQGTTFKVLLPRFDSIKTKK